MPRKFIIGAIVITILLIGIGMYVYFKTIPSVSITTPTENVGGETFLPSAGSIAGKPSKTSTGAGQGTSGTSVESPTAVSARLVKISSGPVVPGEGVVDSKPAHASSSPETLVSYIDRQSGNVFLYSMRTKTLTRTANKTVLGIQSASWLPDASRAFVQYLSGSNFSTIDTYALSATSSGGFFLPQNLSGIAVSSTGILTLASGANGSIASLMRTDGTRPSAVFSTPLSALRISFAGKDRYLAFTKPSATLSGSAFLVDGAGHFSRIAGPLNGLVAKASPSGKWVLVSYTTDTGMRMEIVNTETNAVLPLPVSTIADKCVWATDDSAVYCGVPVNPPFLNYPDDWYQGVASFSDRIWKIQVSGRYAQLVLDFSKEANVALDAEALAINPAGTALVFVNKNDGSLWSYQL